VIAIAPWQQFSIADDQSSWIQTRSPPATSAIRILLRGAAASPPRLCRSRRTRHRRGIVKSRLTVLRGRRSSNQICNFDFPARIIYGCVAAAGR
jgi:hypothetical protein